MKTAREKPLEQTCNNKDQATKLQEDRKQKGGKTERQNSRKTDM